MNWHFLKGKNLFSFFTNYFLSEWKMECYKIHNFSSGKKSQNIILLPKNAGARENNFSFFFLNQFEDICEIISPNYPRREAVSRET